MHKHVDLTHKHSYTHIHAHTLTQSHDKHGSYTESIEFFHTKLLFMFSIDVISLKPIISYIASYGGSWPFSVSYDLTINQLKIITAFT